MSDINVHKTFKQQFGKHSVELGTEYTEPFVSLMREGYELERLYFHTYEDAFRAFCLVQSALSDIDDEGYGYEYESDQNNDSI